MTVALKAKPDQEQSEEENRTVVESNGFTLGPVGATIVGETLIGLIDHYRETNSGGGLDLIVEICADTDDAETGSDCPLTLTNVDINDTPYGYRYMLQNLIKDAGVGEVIDPAKVYCTDESTGGDTECL
jgi:hypothetical protein